MDNDTNIDDDDGDGDDDDDDDDYYDDDDVVVVCKYSKRYEQSAITTITTATRLYNQYGVCRWATWATQHSITILGQRRRHKIFTQLTMTSKTISSKSMTSKPASAKTSSRPLKKHGEPEKLEWALTVPMPKKYKASKRTNNLAKPIRREAAHPTKPLPTGIPPGVLNHRASKRILELSEPKHVANPLLLNVKANPFVVSPSALKYKASKRTKELAEAREYVNNHARDDPFGISPAALLAKPNQRTIELAKPKNISFLPTIF
uniref:Uncharacterized protein n=1 Tax=Glossina austeni TaxID=7395 RepID=A0A1A9USL7_GLOAU